MSIQFGNAKSPVFMRVRRTVPQFTFSLSAHFVNSLSSVSTGFFRFLSVLFENRYIFLINSVKIQVLAANISTRTIPEAPAFLPLQLQCLCLSCCHARRGSAVAFIYSVARPYSVQQRSRHLDRAVHSFIVDSVVKRPPHFVSAVVIVFVFLSFRFREDPPSESNLLPSHQPLRDNQSEE
jgi:hypothetical protein